MRTSHRLVVAVFTVVLAGAIASVAEDKPAPAAPAPAKPATDVPAVVAKVNGTVLNGPDLEAAFKGVRMQMAQSGRQIPEEQLATVRRDLLDEMIARELILQEGKTLGATNVDARVKEEVDRTVQQLGGDEGFTRALAESGVSRDTYVGRVRENAIVEATLRQVVDPQLKVTDDEVKSYYDSNKPRFKHPEMAKAQHILVRVANDASPTDKDAAKAKIEAVRTRAKQGEDFGSLAKQFSEDPGSAPQGGDLGWFPRGAMVPEFDKAAFTLETNVVSETFSTAYGYHVLRVNERKPAGDVPFDEAKPRIEQMLKQQKAQQVARGHVAELRAKAKVEVFLPEPPPPPKPAPTTTTPAPATTN